MVVACLAPVPAPPFPSPYEATKRTRPVHCLCVANFFVFPMTAAASAARKNLDRKHPWLDVLRDGIALAASRQTTWPDLAGLVEQQVDARTLALEDAKLLLATWCGDAQRRAFSPPCCSLLRPAASIVCGARILTPPWPMAPSFVRSVTSRYTRTLYYPASQPF